MSDDVDRTDLSLCVIGRAIRNLADLSSVVEQYWQGLLLSEAAIVAFIE